MITTKETGVQYSFLNQDILDYHKENNFTFSFVTRPLNYEDGEYIDDITSEEIELGTKAVRGFMYREVTDPMFFKVQRGEIEESVWLNEIQKIKDEWERGGQIMANSKIRFGKQSGEARAFVRGNK